MSSKLNREYAIEVLHDKIYDCTGKASGKDIESSTSLTAGAASTGQTNHFPSGQKIRHRNIKINIPKSKLKAALVFPVDGRNPAVHSSNITRYKEMDPEWGLPDSVIDGSSDASLYDFRPTEMLIPAMHGVKGDPLNTKSMPQGLAKEVTGQAGSRRFDHRPLNYRWKVAVLPFFVDTAADSVTAFAPHYFWNSVTSNWTIGVPQATSLNAFVESTATWVE